MCSVLSLNPASVRFLPDQIYPVSRFQVVLNCFFSPVGEFLFHRIPSPSREDLYIPSYLIESANF